MSKETQDTFFIKLPSFITSQKGLSFVELMTVVTIIAVIAMIAYPSFQNLFKKMESKRVQSLLVSHISAAKAQSFSHRQNVILCLADEHGICDRNASDIMILFFDKNQNNTLDTSDQIILKESLNTSYGQLYLRAGGRHYVKFWGDSGTPRGFFGHIKYCPFDRNVDLMYQVSFNQIGKITVKPHNEQISTDCP